MDSEASKLAPFKKHESIICPLWTKLLATHKTKKILQVILNHVLIWSDRGSFHESSMKIQPINSIKTKAPSRSSSPSKSRDLCLLCGQGIFRLCEQFLVILFLLDVGIDCWKGRHRCKVNRVGGFNFNPSENIDESKWESAPSRDENNKSLKPPHRPSQTEWRRNKEWKFRGQMYTFPWKLI